MRRSYCFRPQTFRYKKKYPKLSDRTYNKMQDKYRSTHHPIYASSPEALPSEILSSKHTKTTRSKPSKRCKIRILAKQNKVNYTLLE